MSDNAKDHVSGKLIIPLLSLARFATRPAYILTVLLLIEIATTFETSIGVMSLIQTASSMVGVICSLLMGIMSIRFKHKSLLLSGLLFFSISALGCYFASSFSMMLVFYSITGIGFAMVLPMSDALIGDYLPIKMRAKAIGWMWAATGLAYVISAPIIDLTAGFGGWRLVFIGFVLPISLLAFLSVAFSLPSQTKTSEPSMDAGSYLEAFKAISRNRSAIACLVGSVLSMIAWFVRLSFYTSFLRQHFLVSTGFASMEIIISALTYIFGSVLSGRIVHRVGRKKLTVLTAIPAGLLVVALFNVPVLSLTLILGFGNSLLVGMLLSASNNLTLEQIPRFRGTMMSINTATFNIGQSIGTGLGGLIIMTYSYEHLGIVMGLTGITAGIIYQLLTADPVARAH